MGAAPCGMSVRAWAKDLPQEVKGLKYRKWSIGADQVLLLHGDGFVVNLVCLV